MCPVKMFLFPFKVYAAGSTTLVGLYLRRSVHRQQCYASFTLTAYGLAFAGTFIANTDGLFSHLYSK